MKYLYAPILLLSLSVALVSCGGNSGTNASEDSSSSATSSSDHAVLSSSSANNGSSINNYSSMLGSSGFGSSSVINQSSTTIKTSSSSSLASSSSAQVSSSVLASSSSPCVNTYGTNSVTDCRDGKTYNTVVIGKQIWMAQNLNYGTMVTGKQSTENQSNDSKAEKFCYNDSLGICDKDGGLYQWAEALALPFACDTVKTGSTECPATVATTGNVQGLCPNGWHIPRTYEWDTLQNFQDTAGYLIDATQLKSNTTGFKSWDTTANAGNTSGFSALPAGHRASYGGYYNREGEADFLILEEADWADASWLYFQWIDYHMNFGSLNKKSGFSVRCVKD